MHGAFWTVIQILSSFISHGIGMMRIQCQKRDENNGMAEQSEKVADIDPRFSSLCTCKRKQNEDS